MVRKTCPVDVISVCSASGDIRPLRLRVEDEEQGLIRVNIDEVISVKEVPSRFTVDNAMRCSR